MNTIREDYLTKLRSRDESLLDKNRKSAFNKAINELKAKIDNAKTKCLVKIANQIKLTSDRLIDILADFLAENPKILFPEHKHFLGKHGRIPTNCIKENSEKYCK